MSQQQAEIDNCAFVRKVLGFAKLGTVIQPEIRLLAAQKFDALRASGTIGAERSPRVAQALAQIGNGALPEVSLCRGAMDEIDEFLLPLRRAQRPADLASAVDVLTPRERQ